MILNESHALGGLEMLHNRENQELKQSNEKLKQINQKLNRVNEDLRQFAYIVSHDLNEPLRTIKSYLQLFEKRHKDHYDPTAIKLISSAVEGAIRMQTLIDNLLSYALLSEKEIHLEFFNCQDLLHEILQNLEVVIEEKGAKITHSALPSVKGDRKQLGQLFQNLIGNALKFCTKRSPSIHISAEQKKQKWQFSIQDNGIGIDSYSYEQIFKIFKHLHSRADYPGTGIGLSICQKIVERHGGQIWVESQVDQGSIFYFTLPL